ncbi:TrbL/VirB6 family protein [Wolbachia endosymbiont of Pentidionis agamae]|uniref:type IV secretion system protein n=1 Tax=Wolbachia endosymbiont of Pentidionis agamae TaxID=3110435 RepID=UPI002FD5EC98
MPIIILIAGCGDGMPFPRCISADYFGPKPVTVGAYFSKDDHKAFMPEDGNPFDDKGEYNSGYHPNQVIRWKDTGFETNGDTLVIKTQGAWTSWSQGNRAESKKNYTFETLEQLKYGIKFEGKNEENALPSFNLICNHYKIDRSKETSCFGKNCKDLQEGKSSGLQGAPCWFTNGHGAYLLFYRPKKNDPDPNDNLELMRHPVSPTIHLGYDSSAEGGDGVFRLEKNGDKLKDKDCKSLELKAGWKIYIKILDKYYLDNVGGYAIEFLSGVKVTNSEENIFDKIYKEIKRILLISEDGSGAAQLMFKSITKQGGSFNNFVISVLVLFVIISSILYFMGMVQSTMHDLLIRMMKFALVVLLISPNSWEFFYNNFLRLFVDGLEQIINTITNSLPNSINNEGQLFKFIEDMFNRFFAYSVWTKLGALFFGSGGGWGLLIPLIIIPVIFIGIVLYFLLCLYAFIVFLSGFVGIAFLIAIMPLFLIAILFERLKSLFEEWLKLCINFCLQAIMIFTVLSMFALIIMNTFYRQLGFTVCYNRFLEIKIKPLGLFYLIDQKYPAWTAAQIFVPYTIGEASTYNIGTECGDVSRTGGTLKFTSGVGYIPVPPDYERKDFRFIDFPFFSPFGDNDHYVTESDLIVEKNCSDNSKNLARLVNTLSHASERHDISSIIIKLEEELGRQFHPSNYTAIKQAIDDYRQSSNFKVLKEKITLLMKNIIERNGCTITTLDENYKNKKCKDSNDCKAKYKSGDYRSENDYKRVEDIKRGYLIDMGEILILFMLSFLMFSLRKVVQEIATLISGGGYSIYSISSMYEASPIAQGAKALLDQGKHKVQDLVGGKAIEPLGRWTTGLPNKLAGGTANLLGRIPGIGGVLKQSINIPRNLIKFGVEGTKFITSPEYKASDALSKLYKKFDMDAEPMDKVADRYLRYYQGYVGSVLGYTLKDAMKFNWQHGLDSIKDSEINLLQRAIIHRKKFLEKLHDHTIGRKRKPPKSKKEDKKKATTSEAVKPTQGKSSSEAIKLAKDKPSGEPQKRKGVEEMKRNEDNSDEE